MNSYFLLACCLLFVGKLWAHPMPNSVVNLSVREHSIQGEASMPFLELQSALGANPPADIKDAFFRTYFTEHIRAITGKRQWTTVIDSIGLATDTDEFVGKYQEVLVHFQLIPTGIDDWRQFTLQYDAIVHQVVTHKIIVFVKQESSESKPLGVIKVDVPSGRLFPLEVKLERESWWKGAACSWWGIVVLVFITISGYGLLYRQEKVTRTKRAHLSEHTL